MSHLETLCWLHRQCHVPLTKCLCKIENQLPKVTIISLTSSKCMPLIAQYSTKWKYHHFILLVEVGLVVTLSIYNCISKLWLAINHFDATMQIIELGGSGNCIFDHQNWIEGDIVIKLMIVLQNKIKRGHDPCNLPRYWGDP